MQYEQQPLMGFEAFICNLGGTWGLWTGVSVVGFVQCCYIVACGYWEPDDEDPEDDNDSRKMADARPPPIATLDGSVSTLNPIAAGK